MGQLVWHDAKTKEFVLKDGSPGGYRIEVERCDTAEKLLEWLGHLSQKSWFKTEQVDDLITVCEEVTKVKRARDC